MADRVAWKGKSRELCKQFLHQEIDRAASQSEPLRKHWRGYLEQYRAPIDSGIAHYPFEGASNYTMPVMASDVDPILADYMANIHGPENLWSLKALNERWIDIAKPLQDYMTWLDKMLIKMRRVNKRVFIEMLKLGTSIYKTGWQYERRATMGYDGSKNRSRLTRLINRPVVDHVSLSNFLIPPEAREIDPDLQGGAHWVAERHEMRPLQLKTMGKGQEPFLPNFDKEAVDRVVQYSMTTRTEHDTVIGQLDEVETSMSLLNERPIEFWEVHMRWDTTGNGVEDDIVVFFHMDSMEILRATYATLPNRPYSVVRFLDGDGFYGIGLGEQTELWQDVISNVVNFDMDKLLLAHTPMWGVKEGANVVPDEPIFPGKQWHLADPAADLVPKFMVAPGNFDIMNFLGFLDAMKTQRTGRSELHGGGMSNLPSRTPATTVQTMMSRSNTRFDMSIGDMREGGLAEVGLRVLQNLQAQIADPVSNPEGQDYLAVAAMVLGEPEGTYVNQALQIPMEAIELGLGVQLTATSEVNNKELMRQSNLALLQIMTQLGPGFIQLAQVAAQGGPVGQTASQLFEGARQLVARVLEQFDVRNPEEIIPSLNAQVGAVSQMQGGGQINPLNQGGGAGMPQGPG